MHTNPNLDNPEILAFFPPHLHPLPDPKCFPLNPASAFKGLIRCKVDSSWQTVSSSACACRVERSGMAQRRDSVSFQELSISPPPESVDCMCATTPDYPGLSYLTVESFPPAQHIVGAMRMHAEMNGKFSAVCQPAWPHSSLNALTVGAHVHLCEPLSSITELKRILSSCLGSG